MAKNLLIVESPAKAKTIEKILGSDFEVTSCYGHIRDLEKDDMGIDLKNNYQPRYKVPDEKLKVVKELKQLAKKSNEVWLATDEDREGEAISWHLCEVLGLDPYKTKRIVFHEITKPAIRQAVSSPRTVDMNLVNAQQARRVLDRIVGFELSPVLWRKMSMRNNLSAGRVQSVAVRLVAEREREINAFKAVSSFKVEALFTAPDKNGRTITFKAEGSRFNDAALAESFLQGCIGAEYTVKDIQVKPTKRSPAAPFTTSTLQQEASRKLGYSVSRTMLLAQKLYENGFISYMRTDSVNLSETAMEDIRNTVNSSFGNNYYQARKYKNKSDSAQEAHEAIRPTYMANTTVDDADTRRLYELIWKRTMASQMADAQLEKTIAKIGVSTNNAELSAQGEVMKFDGFMKVYREDRDEEDMTEEESTEGILPPLAPGQKLPLKEMRATERFTRPLPRYTEASLVKKLEELGIGRPSTYAPTISTILKRGYVEKRDKEGTPREYRLFILNDAKISRKTETENIGAEKAKLFPTDVGLLVTDFLKQYFDDIMDYGFTARIEEEFDEVARGKMVWSRMIDDFYNPFKKDVEKTIETAERIKGERELGADPVSGKPVIARMGRYGPMVQIGRTEDEEKPRFAKLKATQSIETINLEEALDLFRLPRNLGTFEDADVSVSIGRFGPYLAHDKKFYSLGKEFDPYSITYDEAVPLIVEKRKAKDERTIKVFEKEKIQLLRGPYGPYIKQGLRNYKLNKEQQERVADLTIEEVKKIIEELKANPPKKTAARKKKA
ncbi:MAG TPA: type I DNA topoisomerase [Chitinophagaceae bacterium]|jgi:DNA topoisomerase-1|nr:type I DNA topoisomerase [Chitinophagaceae bacterium]